MPADTEATATSTKRLWAGRIVSALPVLFLLFSAALKLMKAAPAVEGMARLGYGEDLILWVGILELACTAVYVYPRTSMLGAILLTGYLGGATATQVRAGEPFYGPLIIAALVWLGLYLREERVRALLSPPR